MNALLATLPWWAWSLVSNVAIIATEYINRGSPTIGDALPRTIPLIALAQVGLYYTWSGASSWYVAWVWFAVWNTTIRAGWVASTAYGDEVGNWQVLLLGVAIVFAGAFTVKMGLK